MNIVEDYIDYSCLLQIDELYTKNIHQACISVVNDTRNEIYIEDNDYEGLRTSVDKFETLSWLH